MPGLSFLSKKSWHTSNLKNVEKVWLAEQKSEQEKKRLAELQKQLEEERQIQELRQLQAQHGQVVKTIDTSLDWMYQGPASEVQTQKDSEDYLLGKIYQPKDGKTVDLNVPVNLSTKTDNTWMNKVSNKNDQFSRMHEDPFMMIKMEEKKQRDLVINNPIQMEKIRQKISKDLDDYHYQKEIKKKAKKELKKEKKEEKKKKKKEKKPKKEEDDNNHKDIESKKKIDSRDDNESRSSSSSEDEKDSEDDNRRDRRSPSPLTKKRSRDIDDREDDYYPRDRERFRREEAIKEEEYRRREERGRSGEGNDRRREDSRDRREWRERDQRDSRRSDRSCDRGNDYKRRNDEDYRRSDRSRSRDRNNRDRGDSRHPSQYDEKEKSSYKDRRDDHKEEKDHRGSEEDRSNRRNDGDSEKNKSSGYGLLSRKPVSEQQSTEDKDYLGPRPELLQKKEEERRKQINEKALRGRGGAEIKQLSEEERLRRIAEMEKDAEEKDRIRGSRLVSGKDNEGEEKGLITTDGKGVFLQSMRSEAYRQAAESGLKDRLDQNRNYRQSSHEIENSQSFLKR